MWKQIYNTVILCLGFEINDTSTVERIVNRFCVKEAKWNTSCSLKTLDYIGALQHVHGIFVASVRFCNWFCDVVCSGEIDSLHACVTYDII